MREQACVIKQRPCRRFSVLTYALAAFRYLATDIVALLLALLLVLLIVALGAAIGAVPEQDISTSGDRGAVIGLSPEAKAFFWRAGVEVSLVHPRADFGLATH
jgi:hypothetical protein